MKAWWYDPRTGKAEEIGTFDNKGAREFNPPAAGEMLDWEAPTGGYIRFFFEAGHPVALSRVLLNLTTNALKFTGEGFVSLTAAPGPARAW